ncbi:MAG: hypothetical protein ACFCVA_09590 [Gammaproteobacteria bacterium]
MNLSSMEQRLLALVREYQERECRGLRARAEEKAAALGREAWSDARARLQQAIVEGRARARDRLQQAWAELDTERRRQRQHVDAALLAYAWEQLEAGLIERWRTRNGRHLWITHGVHTAIAVLPERPWVVIHPLDWGAADRLTFAEACPGRPHGSSEFRCDEALQAGLLIRCDGVVLDMTCQGLLADREAIESGLLALRGSHETVASGSLSRRLARGRVKG